MNWQRTWYLLTESWINSARKTITAKWEEKPGSPKTNGLWNNFYSSEMPFLTNWMSLSMCRGFPLYPTMLESPTWSVERTPAKSESEATGSANRCQLLEGNSPTSAPCFNTAYESALWALERLVLANKHNNVCPSVQPKCWNNNLFCCFTKLLTPGITKSQSNGPSDWKSPVDFFIPEPLKKYF